MLQKLNVHLKGIVAWIFVILIAFAFAIWGIENFFVGNTSKTKTLFTIGQSKISQQDLLLAQVRYARFNGKPEAALDNKEKEQVKKILIQSLMLSEAALASGFFISHEQVQKGILSNPAFYENDQFSNEKLALFLQRAAFTLQSYVQEISKQLLIMQPAQGILQSEFALPNELNQFFQSAFQSRTFRYLTVPMTQFSLKTPLTEAELKNYFDSHHPLYSTPEQVSVSYLEISQDALAKKLHLSDQELKDYYQSHLSSYEIPAKYHFAQIMIARPRSSHDTEEQTRFENKIKKVQKGLSKKTAFAELAQTYSDDIFSAKKGGEMPSVTLAQISDPLLSTALSGLKKAGDISEPIETKQGVYFIQLRDIQAKKVRAFSDVKDNLLTLLKQEKVQKLFADQSEQLASLTYGNPDSLAPAAQSLTLEIKTTPLFSRQGGTTELTRSPKLIQAAFSDDVLIQKNNSEVIALDPKTIVVIRLKEHFPEKVKAFDTVKDEIKNELTKQKQFEEAKQFLNTLKETLLKQPAKASALLKERNVHFQEITLTRSEAKKYPNLINEINTIFNMPNPKMSLDGTIEWVQNAEALTLVQLLSVTPGQPPAKLPAPKATLMSQMANILIGMPEYRYYQAAEEKKVPIK